MMEGIIRGAYSHPHAEERNTVERAEEAAEETMQKGLGGRREGDWSRATPLTRLSCDANSGA